MQFFISAAAILGLFVVLPLCVEHRDDFQCPRIHDNDLIVDEEKFISAPIGIDRHDFRGERMEANGSWNPCTDRHRKVDVRRRLDGLLGDRCANRCALFAGQLRACSGLSGSGSGLAFGSILLSGLRTILGLVQSCIRCSLAPFTRHLGLAAFHAAG